ncbi:hypothetical protein MKW92_049981 [Papaver armeniacum]|nr:hypothetical protein MKW92_049981 [Papaver armeniacum]
MATLKSLLPCFLMVLLQVIDGGNNVLCKLALQAGMSPSVMVAYRQIFATIILAPFAFFFERKSMPTITKYIAVQMFLCSFFGATLTHVLYYAGLEHTTPTIACALLNLSPAITFILAIPFRMETITIKTNQGIAKLMGTIICVGGAMVMSFYKGSLINIGTSNIHWRYAVKVLGNKSVDDESNSFLGLTLVFLGVTSWSVCFFAPYTTTTIMCGMASIQCLFIGVLLEGCSVEAWSLASPIRVGVCLYSAAFSSALQFVVISWCISQRGPLYVSMFNPLTLIIVAALGWVIMDEKLYLGSAVGAVLTVIGLYGVLWGKHQEVKNLIMGKSSGPRNGINLDDGKDVEMMGDGRDKKYTGLEQVLWWNPSYEDVEEAGKIKSKNKIALNPT